jgi:hypothetical protein
MYQDTGARYTTCRLDTRKDPHGRLILLHWIEALSWLGKASDVIHNLEALQSIVDVGHALTLVPEALY